MGLIEQTVAPGEPHGVGTRAGKPPPELPSDTALLRRTAAGDVDAFTLLVDRHGSAVLRWAQVLLADRDQARRCVLATFRTLLREASTHRGEPAIRTWLFAEARREATAREPHAVRGGQEPRKELAPTPGTGDLMTALTALPVLQRLTWTLRRVERFSWSDAATVLGTTEDVVRESFEQARETLVRAVGNAAPPTSSTNSAISRGARTPQSVHHLSTACLTEDGHGFVGRAAPVAAAGGARPDAPSAAVG